MDNPFYQNRSCYQKPATPRHSFSHSPSFFGVPVDPIRHPPAEKKSGPKVIRIPVQFFGSDSNRRSESAMKIQKVFRGFLVRNTMRKIKEIKFQVDEIEAKLLRSEVVDLIRQDERERLRVNESLMNMLFKLDGIRGIDLGIRDCRKGVTRKAIALQERIDAIFAVDSQKNNVENAGIGNQELEIRVPAVELVKMECSPENGSAAEMVDCKFANWESSDNFGEMLGDSREEVEDVNCDKAMEVEGDHGDVDVIDVGVACEVKVKVSDKTRVEKEILKNLYFDVDNVESVKETLVESNGKDKIDEWVEIEGERKGKEEDNKRNCELLERMIEDNEKMMRLMTQLFERNEMQAQMFNALTNRVELLEKAYAFDKLKNRRKKKKKAVAAACIKE